MTENPSIAEIRELLHKSRVIAVVGYSKNPARASHWIAEYLQQKGYRIIPVNPGIDAALGEKCYRTLADVPDEVDLVNIFRSPPEVPAIVEEAIRKKAKVVWMQEGAENEPAAKRAIEGGLRAVVGRCIFRDHAALVASQ
ncbi:MAG: CoA-binding protein [Planctomycetota bacterium]